MGWRKKWIFWRWNSFSQEIILLVLHAPSTPNPNKHFVVVKDIYIYPYPEKQLALPKTPQWRDATPPDNLMSDKYNLILLPKNKTNRIIGSYRRCYCSFHLLLPLVFSYRPFKHLKDNIQASRRFKLAKCYRSCLFSPRLPS